MKGYSIIETLIYSTILAFIAVLAVASIISSWRWFQKGKVDAQIARNGEFVLERVVRDVRLADSVGVASVFGSNPGSLELISGATSTKYSLSLQTIQRKEANGNWENLTSADSKITNIIFWNEFTSSSEISSRIIKVEFTLESGDGVFLKQKKFFGSAVLRGSY